MSRGRFVAAVAHCDDTAAFIRVTSCTCHVHTISVCASHIQQQAIGSAKHTLKAAFSSLMFLNLSSSGLASMLLTYTSTVFIAVPPLPPTVCFDSSSTALDTRCSASCLFTAVLSVVLLFDSSTPSIAATVTTVVVTVEAIIVLVLVPVIKEIVDN
jgi:hypothetical protein